MKAQVAVHLNFTIAQEKKSVNPDKIHTDDKHIFCNQNLVMQVIFQKIVCRHFFEVSSIGLKAEDQQMDEIYNHMIWSVRTTKELRS